MSDSSKIIKYIVLTSIFVAIGVIFGFFLNFRIGSGQIYLVGIPIFVMPFILPWNFGMIGTSIIVIMSDLYNGWIINVWISLIAYNLPLIFLYLINTKKVWNNGWWKISISMLFAYLLLLLIYFLLEMTIFDFAFVIADLIATSIQVAISLPMTIFVTYTLLRIVPLINIKF